MSERGHELEEILGMPETASGAGREIPPFAAVWQAAERRRTVRARRRRAARWAAGLAAVAFAAALWWGPLDGRPSLGPGSGPEMDPAVELALAESLSDWTGPLDFLLEGPVGAAPLGGRRASLPGVDAERLIERLDSDLNDLGEAL